MVAEKKKCDSYSVTRGGEGFTLEECAKNCSGYTSMFTFGRKDFKFPVGDYPNPYCNSKGCDCRCLPDARADGTCRMANFDGYDLYAFI